MIHEQSLPRTIKNAWIGALTSIIILIPVTIFTGLEQLGKLDPKLIPAFVILLIAYTVASSYILWGFAQLGNHFTNKLLLIGSLILLVSNILVTVYYILYYITHKGHLLLYSLLYSPPLQGRQHHKYSRCNQT